MTRIMYDSITVSNIPATAKMVAGYVNGHWANYGAMKKRFSNARVVSISVNSTTKAQVLDVEPGDATAETAVYWCTHTMADTPNDELTIYCNASTWPSVKAAFKAAGVTLPQWWEAHYDGVAKISTGAVAKQYANNAKYDTSIVADYWPGVDPKPSAHVVKAVPFPGAAWFNIGRKSPIVAAMHKRLVAVGCNHYKSTSNIDVIGSGDEASYEAWQRKCGFSGTAAEWPPGKTSWDKLGVKI